MCKKLIHLATFGFVLSLVLTGAAKGVDPSLVAWYRFDGNALDSSGNNLHGTVMGNPTYTTGVFGQAIDLDGDGDYIDCGLDPKFDITEFITFTYWIKVRAFDAAWQTVLSRGDDSWRSSRAGSSGTESFMEAAVGGTSGNYLYGVTTVDDGQWHHVGATYDGTTFFLYVDGELDASEPSTGQITVSSYPLYIGENSQATGRHWNGLIDDVMIFNRAFSHEEIQRVMQSSAGAYPFASGPNPPDGALHPDTWITLSWNAGDFAVSHDVYLGESFDDVHGATNESSTFRGNQGETFYIAGFPGFAYPEGLVPGTTYYWRVDEVNEADPNSPWKGPVWSFFIPPLTAYDPIPADGSLFVAMDAKLNWTPGFGSKLHTVYFGTDLGTVTNATGGKPQTTTTYNPGPLQPLTTYYWRVDEFTGAVTLQGDVWSFTTAKEGGGVKGEYFNNIDLSGQPVLVRIDPQINFYWNPGPVGPGVNEDNFSVRWTGELEAPFSEPFTFIIGCDDGARMYLNGELIIDDWGAGHDYLETRSQPIDLVADQYYSMVVEGFELGGEAEWRLFWESPSLPRDYVPQAALSLPVKAGGPYPANGSTGVSLTPILTWNPGDYAASHEVYFGIDEAAVTNATKASPEFKATKALGDESYDPGKLSWNTTYYWRVDEVNNLHPDSPWVGSVWSFTTGDFLLVDDFESYTDNDTAGEAIWQSWIDGFGVADNGSQVGNLLPPYAEQTIVHSGRQSMNLLYNNVGGVTNSEASLKLVWPRDWTEENVAELSLWFHGLTGSVGSFVEGPVGTFTMTGAGTDITGTSDEFHYAYKSLTGAGSIVARVMSVQNTNAWAKAGVMIRQTLDAGSAHAMTFVTPGNGVVFEYRSSVGANNVGAAGQQTGITAPHWVKVERDIAGNFTASHSANGTAWQSLITPQNLPMGSTVYIGLALTSHDAALTCQAVFSNVTTTGNVSGQWQHQDIGIAANAAEPLYVAVSNASGAPAIIANSDPAAAQIDDWVEWPIPLQAFADQGINLRNVDKIAIGLGSKSGMASAGGSGTMYIDDIRLYRPAP